MQLSIDYEIDPNWAKNLNNVCIQGGMNPEFF